MRLLDDILIYMKLILKAIMQMKLLLTTEIYIKYKKKQL